MVCSSAFPTPTPRVSAGSHRQLGTGRSPGPSLDEGHRPRAGGGLEEGAQDRQSPERALHQGPLVSWGPWVWEQLSAHSAVCRGTREAGPDQLS